MDSPERLTDLLILWDELRQRGTPPSPDELCPDSPTLRTQLEERIHALKKMESVLGMATAFDAGPRKWTADAERPLPRIPEYEVVDVLGRGGMGIVYRAKQLRLGRMVAVKVLDASLTGTPQLERFLDEAHAVARLHHPNIVQIHDFGQVDGVPFFSMEYVEGGNLKARLTQESFTPDQAAHCMEAIARAIHRVHKEGFAHRDLKPANILLTREGHPKVTDFGLVKRLDEEPGITQTGEVLGTIGYMAPEQLDPARADIGPHTDVYAMGALLYEMLTGEPAFASNAAVALQQVLQGDITLPTRLRPSVPRDLEAISLQCLESDVAQRYDSAENLADDLRRFLEKKPVHARRVSPTRRVGSWLRRRPRLVVFLALTALVLSIRPINVSIEARRARAERQAQALRVAPQAREILERNCYSCHGAEPEDVREELDVLDHNLLIHSDRRIVVPGKPEDSRLLQRIADGSMPPEDMERELPRLTEQELVILNEWILGGAPSFPTEDPLHPTPPVVEHSPLAARAKQILDEHCYECHKYDVAEGGIKILHHRLLLHVRKVVVPGDADASELFQLLTSADEDSVMPPPDRESLTRTEIMEIRRWIEAGAPAFPKTENLGSE